MRQIGREGIRELVSVGGCSGVLRDSRQGVEGYRARYDESRWSNCCLKFFANFYPKTLHNYILQCKERGRKKKLQILSLTV